jgi:hypothetical protein
MSFPPGTEMFQFPGFASPAYGFSWQYPRGWVAPFGCPRINACSRLPMAFRSVPRPSSPPGAKASTECPSLARNQAHVAMNPSHHAQEPSTPYPDANNPATRQASYSAHTHFTPLNANAAAAGRHAPLTENARTGQTLRLRRKRSWTTPPGSTPRDAPEPDSH